jgi:N-acetylglucosamine-6-phosphate deacetylase
MDIHIHGSGGADVMDATPRALHTISNTLPQTGTTAFLATTMTMPQPEIDRAVGTARAVQPELKGAKLLGVHLEGPFINPQKHGAQDASYVQVPSLSSIDMHLDMVKMITMAPEVEGAETFMRQIKKTHPHIVLSIGHSDADYAQTMQSFTEGISHATHLFNAMSPFHHRAPGIAGAVFDSEVTCDVIADGIHLHPSLLRLTQRMKQEKLILITDAMRAGCMKCGTYDLGGQAVTVAEGRAVLADGTLAGSVLRMNEALCNMHRFTGMSIPECVYSVTEAPARLLGVESGRLAVGMPADIVIFDEDFSIITTIIDGEIVYERNKER